MKRLLLLVALLALFAAPAFAAGETNDDVLVAPDGTVYVLEVVSSYEVDEETTVRSALTLRTTRGEDTITELVPGSAGYGENSEPALAFDPTSETLFILWVRAPQITTSEILLTSYRQGAFGETTAIDLGVMRYRENLQVAITKYADNTTGDEGEEETRRDTILGVHAVWWDHDGAEQRARYALLQVTGGVATVVAVRDLVDVLGEDRNLEPIVASETFDPAILHVPGIDANPALDRADIVFGDPATNRMYRLELLPVASNGVLRMPIGVRRTEFPAPVAESIAANSTTAVIAHPVDHGALLLYTVEDGRVEYLVYEDGAWSEARTVALGEKITFDVAVDALKRRLVQR